MKWRSLEARFDLWMNDGLENPHEWHPWFVWYPKRIGDMVYWLVIVQRRLEYGGAYNSDYWRYKL